MFNQHSMFSSIRIPRNNNFLSHNTTNKEDFEDEEEDLVEEADEVTDLSNATIVAYLGIIKDNSHNCSANEHIVLQLITLLRTVHS